MVHVDEVISGLVTSIKRAILMVGRLNVWNLHVVKWIDCFLVSVECSELLGSFKLVSVECSELLGSFKLVPHAQLFEELTAFVVKFCHMLQLFRVIVLLVLQLRDENE